MRFGFFVMNQYVAGEDMAQKVREAVEQVRLARDAGFDMVATGQHYLAHPYQMPTTLPFLARLAAEAGEMRVGATVVLLPLHNPVEVAESVATLDAITGGRFTLGVGLGYREEEFQAFGTTMRERVPRMLEALEVVRALWRAAAQGEEMEFRGRFFRVPRVRPMTRPVQRPHPPIWVAANNDAAIVRAARLGFPWLVNPHATVATVERQAALYRQALQEAGHRPDAFPMMRELYVHPDRAQALAQARPYLEPKYAAYAAWGQDRALPGEESFRVPFDELARDRFLVGTPEEVVAEVRRYQERLGVDWMLFRMQWPGMPHAQVVRQLELFGERVIPHFKQRAGAKA